MNIEPPVPAQELAAIRAPFLAHGAADIDPPILQPLNRLLDLTGETLRARLFVVQDEGGREACLRPDFTLAVADAHVAAGGGLGLYRYEGKAFRVSPAHAAHAEEFVQIGLEGFGGPAGPKVDAGVIALAWRAAIAGGRADLTLRLGDMGLFETFLAAIGVAGVTAARLRRALAKPKALAAELARAQTPPPPIGQPLARKLVELSRSKAVALLEESWAIAQVQPIGGRTAAEVVARLSRLSETSRAPRMTADQADLIGRYAARSGAARDTLAGLRTLVDDKAFHAALDGWTERLDTAVEEGVAEQAMIFDAGFGRTFSYYDGFLFEIVSAALGADAPVAAGGRYDRLLGQLSGVAASAVGCMVRPGRAWAGAAR